MIDDHDPEIPPTPRRVASRALVMAGLVHRASVEHLMRETAEEERRRIITWLEALELRPEAEEREWSLLATPIGALTDRDRIDTTWRSEGVAVLAWSAYRFQPPSYDVQVNPRDAAESLDLLDDRARVLIETDQMRPEQELFDLRETCLALHWRLREHHLRPGRNPAPPCIFVSNVSYSACDPIQIR